MRCLCSSEWFILRTFCYFWKYSSHFNSSFFPLRAGSGTVQLVTGWEKICLLLTRQGSLVRTMEPPLLPLPIGTYGIILPHSDLKVIAVCFVSADFLKSPPVSFKGSSRPSPTAWCSVALVIPSGSASMTRAAPAPSTGSAGMKCPSPTGIETSQVRHIQYVVLNDCVNDLQTSDNSLLVKNGTEWSRLNN